VAKGVFVRVILAGLLAVLLGASAFAQSPTGSIGGIVFDADARAISGAEIIVVNDLTRVQYETKTNDVGIYAVANLPPGPYRVQASRVGFKTLIKPDIILNVQDSITVNFTLPVGATSIAVTVEGGAPMINTTDATVSTVVDRQFAENLPMNGRSFQTLIYLAPGVVPVPADNGFDGGQFSVNGQRAASNYWMVDGVSANFGVGANSLGGGNGFGGAAVSFSAFGGTNSLVSVDAMQEFRIQTSTFAPEFGRTPGGQISIVTRSGTNDWHGTAFDYLRNDALDANSWFANEAELPKPEERQNDFGGTLAGPLLKNRTFFFFSYEGLRLRLPQTSLTNVPDRTAREDALRAIQPYLNAFPQPNGGDNPTTGVAEFNATYSNPATLDAYSLRIDHKLNDKWNIFGRYNYSPSEFTDRGGSSGFGALSIEQPTKIETQTATIGATWASTSMVSNDLRFNYSRTNAQSYYYLDSFGGAVPLVNLPFPAGYGTQNAIFNLQISGLGVGQIIEVGKNSQNVQHQVNVVEAVSLLKGTHSFKFGMDYRRLSPENLVYSYEQGARFGTVADAETGSSLIGVVQSRKSTTLLFHNLGIYAQDTWRVKPRLTATFGIRWDTDFAPSSLQGGIPALSGYNLNNLSDLAISPAGTPPFKTTYDNFAPRLGVAYEAFQKHGWRTVVRTGFGVFYDLVSANTGGLINSVAPPFGAQDVFRGGTFPFSPDQIASLPVSSVATLSNFAAFNPNLKLPYTLEWNVTLEQSLGKDQTLSASYVGAAGRRLLQSTFLISPPANPAIEQGILTDNTAASDYNALQISFQRRLSNGLQAIASYTFSHSIDDASAGSVGDASNLSVPGSASLNRGNSGFDIRHSFTAGLTYDIPTLRRGALVKAILGGWSTENFILARSGPPVDLSDEDFFLLDSGVEANIRPDVVPGRPYYLYGSQYPGGRAFNPAAFQDPPTDPTAGNPLRQGNLGRNVLRGFGATEWDLAVHRDFHLRESIKLQFRAEMFNVLNHPTFGPPSGEYLSPAFGGPAGFGLSTQTLAQSLVGSGGLGGGAFNPLYQIGGPRSIQIALKLSF
jgi:Carboxypeptidase regulatory-like domain/TonB dependent receptor